MGAAIHVFSLRSGALLATLRKHFQPVTALAFTEDANLFASAAQDGFVYVWRVASVMACVARRGKVANLQPHKLLGQHRDKVRLRNS